MWLEPSYFYGKCKLYISDFFPQVWENTQEIKDGFALERKCAVCVRT